MRMCLRTAMAGGNAWWVAPNYKTAEVGWKLLQAIAGRMDRATIRLSDKSVTIGKGIIQIRSAHEPDNLRGEALDLVVFDEASLIGPKTWYEVIRPALSDRRGRAMFISTPGGRNWFWELYIQDDPDWKSFSFPTSGNPFIDKAEIEMARAGIPDRVFRQEYLAEFVDDGSTLFRNIIPTCTFCDHRQKGNEYVIGVDWGKLQDFTVFTVLETTGCNVVHIKKLKLIDYLFQVKRLKELYNTYNPTLILAESNAMGIPIIEQVEAEGLPIQGFTMTNPSKKDIIESLILAFERKVIHIPDDPDLIKQLLAYQATRTPGGLIRYAAPGTMHDDHVISLALAWRAKKLRKCGSGLVEMSIPGLSLAEIRKESAGLGSTPYQEMYREKWGLRNRVPKWS